MASPSTSQRQHSHSRSHSPHPTTRSPSPARDREPPLGMSPSGLPPPIMQTRPPGHPAPDRSASVSPALGVTVADRSSASRERDRDSSGSNTSTDRPSSQGDRPSSQGRSSSKAVLTLALQKAHNAVVLDRANDVEKATAMYREAVELLAQVMDTTGREEDRAKLRHIHDTYQERIRLLTTISPRNSISEQGSEDDSEYDRDDDDGDYIEDDISTNIGKTFYNQPAPPSKKNEQSAQRQPQITSTAVINLPSQAPPSGPPPGNLPPVNPPRSLKSSSHGKKDANMASSNLTSPNMKPQSSRSSPNYSIVHGEQLSHQILPNPVNPTQSHSSSAAMSGKRSNTKYVISPQPTPPLGPIPSPPVGSVSPSIGPISPPMGSLSPPIGSLSPSMSSRSLSPPLEPMSTPPGSIMERLQTSSPGSSPSLKPASTPKTPRLNVSSSPLLGPTPAAKPVPAIPLPALPSHPPPSQKSPYLPPSQGKSKPPPLKLTEGKKKKSGQPPLSPLPPTNIQPQMPPPLSPLPNIPTQMPTSSSNEKKLLSNSVPRSLSTIDGAQPYYEQDMPSDDSGDDGPSLARSPPLQQPLMKSTSSPPQIPRYNDSFRRDPVDPQRYEQDMPSDDDEEIAASKIISSNPQSPQQQQQRQQQPGSTTIMAQDFLAGEDEDEDLFNITGETIQQPLTSISPSQSSIYPSSPPLSPEPKSPGSSSLKRSDSMQLGGDDDEHQQELLLSKVIAMRAELEREKAELKEAEETAKIKAKKALKEEEEKQKARAARWIGRGGPDSGETVKIGVIESGRRRQGSNDSTEVRSPTINNEEEHADSMEKKREVDNKIMKTGESKDIIKNATDASHLNVEQTDDENGVKVIGEVAVMTYVAKKFEIDTSTRAMEPKRDENRKSSQLSPRGEDENEEDSQQPSDELEHESFNRTSTTMNSTKKDEVHGRAPPIVGTPPQSPQPASASISSTVGTQRPLQVKRITPPPRSQSIAAGMEHIRTLSREIVDLASVPHVSDGFDSDSPTSSPKLGNRALPLRNSSRVPRSQHPTLPAISKTVQGLGMGPGSAGLSSPSITLGGSPMLAHHQLDTGRPASPAWGTLATPQSADKNEYFGTVDELQVSFENNLPSVAIEPPPSDPHLRPFWLMRSFYKSMANGCNLTKKLYIPRALWFQANVRLNLIEQKIAACEQLIQIMHRMEKWTDFSDLNGTLKIVADLDVMVEGLHSGLGKKLGLKAGGGIMSPVSVSEVDSDIGIEVIGKKSEKGRKSQPGIMAGWSKLSNRITLNGKIGDESNALYIETLMRLFMVCQVHDNWLRHYSMSNSGAVTPPSQLGIQQQILFKLTKAADGIGLVIIGFVVRDLAVFLGKWVKKSGSLGGD